MMNMNRLMPSILALLIVWTLLPDKVYAGTQAQYQAVHEWCAARDKLAAEGRKSELPAPKEYFHFHHFCNAIRILNKAYSTINNTALAYEISGVIGETDYVIAHVPADHFLMADVFAVRGQALLLGHKNGEAESALMKALQLDPKHVGALLSLARLYADTNRKDKAIEAIRAGLAIEPENKPLRRQATKFNLELPPLQEQAEVAPTTKSDAPASRPNAPQETTRILDGKGKDVPGKDVGDTANLKPARTPIGKPNNPWCRFCPEAAPQPNRPASSPATESKAGQ